MLPRSVLGALGLDDTARMTTAVTATAPMAVQNHQRSKMGGLDAGETGAGAVDAKDGGGAAGTGATAVGSPAGATGAGSVPGSGSTGVTGAVAGGGATGSRGPVCAAAG